MTAGSTDVWRTTVLEMLHPMLLIWTFIVSIDVVFIIYVYYTPMNLPIKWSSHSGRIWLKMSLKTLQVKAAMLMTVLFHGSNAIDKDAPTLYEGGVSPHLSIYLQIHLRSLFIQWLTR